LWPRLDRRIFGLSEAKHIRILHAALLLHINEQQQQSRPEDAEELLIMIEQIAYAVIIRLFGL
jgi:hypothetical protein